MWELQFTDEVKEWLRQLEPRRASVLLVAGDKRGLWKEWYRQVIPRAEQLFAIHVRDRTTEERNS